MRFSNHRRAPLAALAIASLVAGEAEAQRPNAGAHLSIQLSDSSGATPREASWGGSGDAGEPLHRVVEVEMHEFQFQADTVRVEAGGTVRWINRDAVAHTSTADDGSWRSPLLGPGETYTAAFERAGSFSYHCLPHPRMRGVVIVEPNGQAASDSATDRRSR